MKNSTRLLSLLLTLFVFTGILMPTASAREFSPLVKSSNLGVNTQYVYDADVPSWLRQLTIKEDMLSTSGIATENTLYPVCDYPYRIDAPGFEKEVDSYVSTYTLTEDSERAAYLYLFKQIGAINVISDPAGSDVDKIAWLRSKGIIITEEQETDPDSLLMIGALYAIMKNDLYYVYKNDHLEIPVGTGLEPALMMYLIAFSGQNNTLISFIQKYFGTSSVGSLEDYIYYTSLMTLFVSGYLSVRDIPNINRDEVYRRMAIMAISEYGIAIDADNASAEEIRQKYLAAMIGSQYEITVDPNTFLKAQQSHTIPYYILQRMALEDSKVTISQKKYTYIEAFDIVLKKTTRFNLENEFFSDIYSYNVYLKNLREFIYINPNPIEKFADGMTVYINGKKAGNGQYAKIELQPSAQKQSVDIVCRYSKGNTALNSYYHLNVYEGTGKAPDSDLTGIVTGLVPTGGTDKVIITDSNGNTIDYIDPSMTYIDGSLPLVSNIVSILTLNDKGQLVDQYGNIVSGNTYETLSPGYEYVLNEDGSISIQLIDVPDDDSTTAKGDDGSGENDFSKWKSIIVASSVFFLLALIFILILVFHTTSKRKSKSNKPDKNLKSRKEKEKRKRLKQEEKAEKKSAKKKK